MQVLCALRAEAKGNKDWATADLIRDRLADLGVDRGWKGWHDLVDGLTPS